MYIHICLFQNICSLVYFHIKIFVFCSLSKKISYFHSLRTQTIQLQVYLSAEDAKTFPEPPGCVCSKDGIVWLQHFLVNFDIYIYICIYVYVYIYTYIHTFIYIHTYIYVYVYLFILYIYIILYYIIYIILYYIYIFALHDFVQKCFMFIINEKTFLKITSVIFQLFTNLLRTNLNKNCENVYVIRIVTR